MDTARVGIAALPHLLGGEDQHRRGVADQALEQDVEHRAIGHPRRICRIVAIEAVLADIEEEGRQVLVAEVDQRPDIFVEVVGCDRAVQRRIKPKQFIEHIAFQLRHGGEGDTLRLSEPVERAEQVAEGVPELAILVADAFRISSPMR